MFDSQPFYQHLWEFFWLHEFGKESCNTTFRSEALYTVLHERKQYDVLITEQFNTDCVLGIAHALKAPIVGLSSSALMPWYYHRFGIPAETSYIPTEMMGHSEEMSFLERISNWFNFHLLNFLYG